MARLGPRNGTIAETMFVGFDELIAAMGQLESSSQMRQAVEGAVRPAATLMAREIRKRAPKRTGKLKRAIKVSKKGNIGRNSQWRGSLNRMAVKLFVGIDASVDEGHPAKSQTIKRGKKKGRARKVDNVNSVAARAAVLEFGSPHVRAVGMFRGGYQATKGEALRMMSDNMMTSISTVMTRTRLRRAKRAARLLT